MSWNEGLIEIFMLAQLEGARTQANLITGGQIHRIDAVTCPSQFLMDDAGGVRDLIALGETEARKIRNVQAVQQRFLNDIPAPPIQPVYRPQSTSSSPTG